MKFLNRKAQFGPDVLIGFLLIAILGLGGILFINTFVSGLSLTGLVNVLDSETDMKCFYMLLPLTGSDYIRSGIPESSLTPQLKSLKSFFGGYSFTDYEVTSYEFEEKISALKTGISQQYPEVSGFPATVVSVAGHMATPEKMAALLKSDAAVSYDYILCSMPVYGPAGFGQAELRVALTGET